MIIVMSPASSEADLQHLVESIEEWGLTANISRGTERTVVGIIGDEAVIETRPLDRFPGVESAMRVTKPYKMASREFHADRSQITVKTSGPHGKEVVVGGKEVVVIAGPCSVETKELLQEMAEVVEKGGARILRGGAFKPRTSPYSFQGLGAAGLDLLAEAREETGLPIITEVMDIRNLELVESKADILQVGARNMQNFDLLKALGGVRKPVMLKRGLASTLDEFLMSAEYILSNGNEQVILCERGIRTFETKTRNTVDISAVPVLKRESHLPVFVDPSHGTGHWDLVAPLARAAVAAGADGIVVEIHPRPEEAPCDGSQALKYKTFATMMDELRAVASAVGRPL